MNTSPPSPSDGDLDRLLSRTLKDTTPEFEARWVELKRKLRNAPRRRSGFWPRPLWSVLLATGVAAAALLLIPRAPNSAPAEVPPALAELWAMDEVLAGSTALLNSETRTELLYVEALQPLSPKSP